MGSALNWSSALGVNDTCIPVLLRLIFLGRGDKDFAGKRMEYNLLLVSVNTFRCSPELTNSPLVLSFVFSSLVSVIGLGWAICTVVPCQLDCCLPQYTLASRPGRRVEKRPGEYCLRAQQFLLS